MRVMKWYFWLVGMSLSLCAVQIPGNQNPTVPFSFSVGPMAFDTVNPNAQNLFVGALDPVADNQFALSVASPFSSSFTPLAREKATVAGVENSDNPLFGESIQFISFFAKSLTDPITGVQSQSLPIIFAGDSTKPYFILDYSFTSTVVSLFQMDSAVLDFGGLAASSLAGLKGAADSLDPMLTGFFAAVRDNAGNPFGEPGSDSCITTVYFTGKEANPAQPYTFDQQNISFLIDPSTEVFKTGVTDLFAINNDALGIPVALEYHPDFAPHVSNGLTFEQCVFVGLAVESAAGGALSVSFAQKRIVANPSAIGADSIIGTSSASTEVTAFFVKIMRTTTFLDYLIVVGGVGDPNATQSSVYALPLVNNPSSEYLGQLASKTALPEYAAQTEYPFILQNVFLSTPALVNADLYTSTDIPVQVGGGALPDVSGVVSSITVVGDAVYVAMSETDDPTQELPGFFVSQALFDQYGRVKGWTPWRRVAGYASADQPSFIAVDQYRGAFWYATGAPSSTSITRTNWSYGGSGLLQNFSQTYFPVSIRGVQGYFDFPALLGTIFADPLGQDFMLLTGYQKIALALTAATDGGLLTPVTTFDPVFESSDGSLSGLGSQTSVVVSGGALNTLGPIIAGAIAYNDIFTEQWLCVGGNGGFAVFTDEAGSAGLLNAAASARIFGSYKNVRKLISDNGFLYIVTDTQVDRVAVSSATFSTAFEPTTIYQVSQQGSTSNATITDFIVSSNLALVATNSGVFRVGNGSSAQTDSFETMNWTEISVPEGVGSANRFFVLSQSKAGMGWAEDQGGDVYLMSSYVGYSQARIYRYAITPGTVSDDTVQQLPDFFTTQTPRSFFLNSGVYRNYAIPDGGLFFMTRSAYVGEAPLVEIIPAQYLAPSYIIRDPDMPFQNRTVSANRRFAASHRVTVLSPAGYTKMGPVAPYSATGAQVVSGDFGLAVNA